MLQHTGGSERRGAAAAAARLLPLLLLLAPMGLWGNVVFANMLMLRDNL